MVDNNDFDLAPASSKGCGFTDVTSNSGANWPCPPGTPRPRSASPSRTSPLVSIVDGPHHPNPPAIGRLALLGR